MCEIQQSVMEKVAEHESEYHKPTPIKEEANQVAPMTLLDMPIEIIIKIATYLDVRYIKETLTKVCKRFEDILGDYRLWKYWVHSKIKGCYPPLPNLRVYRDVNIDWGDVCIEMEVEKRKWTKSTENFRHIVVKDVHYASVDTVLLIHGGYMCVSGGRDRGMALWDIMEFKPPAVNKLTGLSQGSAKPRHITHDAHAGWVWDLAADDLERTSIIYSASWDNTVKAWDLRNGLQNIETFRCGISALSLATCDNVVMTGLYSKKVLSFDLRAGPSPISSYKAHKGPVLSLNHYNNMIASVSEDKTLAIYDRTAGKVLKTEIKIPSISEKAYPVCVNWKACAMYVGDSKGCLHLFNPEKYSFVKTYEVWPESSEIEPSYKIAGCYQSRGNIIVCSDRGEIKFMYNSNPPQPYCTIRTTTVDVTQLRYLNGILVTSTCDSALEFWVPREKYREMCNV